MLTTLELRWFYPGIRPLEVEQWFNNDCPGELLGLPEEREDWYLYTPDCPYLNLKLRQGSLEVKWRKRELGRFRFGNFWEGTVEEWLKWSCDDPAQEIIVPGDSEGKRSWVGVRKVRSQRLYQDIACELTQLTVRNQAWWTVAFELQGEAASQLDQFNHIIGWISQTYQGLELQLENSYAYPTWLSPDYLDHLSLIY